MIFLIVLLSGCADKSFLLLDADVNGTDVNLNYLTSETRVCVDGNALCMDFNGDGLIG